MDGIPCPACWETVPNMKSHLIQCHGAETAHWTCGVCLLQAPSFNTLAMHLLSSLHDVSKAVRTDRASLTTALVAAVHPSTKPTKEELAKGVGGVSLLGDRTKACGRCGKQTPSNGNGKPRTKILPERGLHKVKGLFKAPAFARPVRNSATFSDSLSAHADSAPAPGLPNAESADDILRKYENMSKEPETPQLISIEPTQPTPPTEEPPLAYYDPQNPLGSKAFLDAKRKLRLVLSAVDTAALPAPPPASPAQAKGDGLRAFLRLLLAEAIHSQDKTLAAQLREVLRCLGYFESVGLSKLLKSLRSEQERRGEYLAYLQQSRHGLLQLQALVRKLERRVGRNKDLNSENLVEVLVRLYMERKDELLGRFMAEFRTLSLPDEKADCVAKFLARLNSELREDPAWREATDDELAVAQRSLERALMASIYQTALFPNGDADRYRDTVLHQHIARIAAFLQPAHPALAIPPLLHAEAPWPSAQAYFRFLSAYKSPRDKVACVVRGCETIEGLLHMALSRPPAADDVTPVLVYVLIKANPASLMSQLSYMEGFCAGSLTGEEQYRWTQFTSALEYIKQLVSQLQ